MQGIKRVSLGIIIKTTDIMKNYSEEIAEVTTQLELIRAQRRELGLANDAKIKDLFDHAFNYFREFDIRVSSETASFFNAEDNKQLFTIYFYERYSEDTRLELSYYSTSTQSDFELDRLISIGKVAQIIKSNSERILRDIADIKKSDKGRESELYAIQDTYEKRLSEIRKAEYADMKVQTELQLRGDGVVFNEGVYIEFKRNYSIKVLQMKMIDLSKSGKTCTIVYSTRDGYQTREENCNVENILNQVIYFRKNIVEALFPQ